MRAPINRQRECHVTRCVNELENWKLLFIVVFNEYKRNTKEGANRSECLAAPIDRAALEFPLEISPTSLYICDKLSSTVRTFTSHEKERELASFNLRARFIIMAAVFDRFVIPRFFARASPLLFPGCFHSRVLLQFPMRIGYFGLPPGSSLSRAERKSRHRISGIRGTNDFVGWLRYLKLDTPRDPANIPFPISDALFLSFRFTFESSLCELIAT